MGNVPEHFYRQSGVVPYRWNEGELQILLITSHNNRRWTIPKGVVEPHLSSADSALKEAYEEAGLKGVVEPTSFATYEYSKWGGTCTVEVFLVRVVELVDRYPESSDRKRKWLPPATAVKRVKPASLAEVVQMAVDRLREALE